MNCLRARDVRMECEYLDPSAAPLSYYAPQLPYNPQFSWGSQHCLETEYAEYEYASCAYEADDECEGWGTMTPRRSLYEGVNCLPPASPVSAATSNHQSASVWPVRAVLFLLTERDRVEGVRSI